MTNARGTTTNSAGRTRLNCAVVAMGKVSGSTGWYRDLVWAHRRGGTRSGRSGRPRRSARRSQRETDWIRTTGVRPRRRHHWTREDAVQTRHVVRGWNNGPAGPHVVRNTTFALVRCYLWGIRIVTSMRGSVSLREEPVARDLGRAFCEGRIIRDRWSARRPAVSTGAPCRSRGCARSSSLGAARRWHGRGRPSAARSARRPRSQPCRDGRWRRRGG